MDTQELAIDIAVKVDDKDATKKLKDCQKTLGDTANKAEKLGESGKKGTNGLMDGIKNVTKNLPSFGGVFSKVGGAIENTWKSLDTVFKASVIVAVIDQILGIVDRLKVYFDNLTMAGGLVGAIFQKIAGFVKGVIQVFKDLTDMLGLTTFEQDKQSKAFLDNVAKEKEAIEQYYKRRLEIAKAAGEQVKEIEAESLIASAINNEKALREYEDIISKKGKLNDEDKEKYKTAQKDQYDYGTQLRVAIAESENSFHEKVKDLTQRRITAEISMMKDGVAKNNALLNQKLGNTKLAYTDELKALQDSHAAQLKQIDFFYKYWGDKSQKALAVRIADNEFKKQADELLKTQKAEQAAAQKEAAVANKAFLKEQGEKRIAAAQMVQQKLLSVEQKAMALTIADGKELTAEKTNELNTSLKKQEQYTIALQRLQKYTGKDKAAQMAKDVLQIEDDFYQKRKANIDAFNKYTLDNDQKLNKAKADLAVIQATTVRDRQVAQKAAIDADLAIAEQAAKDTIKNEELKNETIAGLRAKATADKKVIDDKVLEDERQNNIAALTEAAEHQQKMAEISGKRGDQISALKAVSDAKNAQLISDMNAELAIAETTGKSKADIAAKYNNQIAENEKETQKQIRIVKTASVADVLMIAKAGTDALIALNDFITEKDSQNDKKTEAQKLALAKRNFNRQKALGAVSAAINTAQAITSALATSGPPWVGIAMAAITGAMGAVQIAAILSKKFDGSGATDGTDGGSSSPLTGGAAAAASAAPQFNPSTFANMGNAQISNVSSSNTRVYVLESDITMSQNRVSVIQERARITGP